MLEGFDIEGAGFGIEEGHHVERSEIAGGVVEEHVLGAVVDGDAVGDERVRDRLGEVEDLLGAEGGYGLDVIEVFDPGGLRTED